MPAAFKWTEEQIQNMIASYKQGESMASIARRYETSHQVIGPVLKKHGVILKEHSENMRRHTCNHAYFRTIDSEEKAYWLGFFTADGYITTGDRVAVHLALMDREHLYKFKRVLEATQEVSEDSKRCSLVICSPEIASDLALHGILPNKTFTTKPAQVAPELARHYWRGVVDGDGSFARDGSELKLCGDYEVVMAFQMFVLSHCPEVRANIRKTENIYTFTIKKQATHDMLQALYEDASIYLERKYKQAMRILHD